MVVVFETESPAGADSLIREIFGAAAKMFGLPQKTEVLISFLTERQIKEVNNRSRGVNAVTDVLSFPYINALRGKNITLKDNKTDINPFTKRLMLGEINICAKRAENQAAEYGHSLSRETGYLALHGLLHILGFDHIEEKDKKIMRKTEEKILRSLNITR